MSTYKYLSGKVLLALCLLLAGCDWSGPGDPLPEVNEENCLPENSGRIKSLDARKKFVETCVQRISVKRSTLRGW